MRPIRREKTCKDSLEIALSSSVTFSGFLWFAVIRAVRTFDAFLVTHSARGLASFSAGGSPPCGP